MIKRISVTLATVFAGVVIGVLLALAGHSDSLALAQPASSGDQSVSGSHSAVTTREVSEGETIAAPSKEGYYIKEYKGRVSVLKGDSPVPEMVFDIQTKLLPELDRQQLSEGIYVETYEELIRLVEDYIS